MIDIQYLNTASFFWLNHAAHVLPDWLWSSLTITGHTSMVFALLTPLLLTQRGSVVISALWVCSILGGLVVTVLKESFQLLRPPAVLSPESFHLIGHKLELVSFPSGHSVTAFAVATLMIVGLRLRGWHILLATAAAFAIGLSRIAVGAHWPLDVLTGAVLGVVCAYVSLWVTKSSYIELKLINNVIYHRVSIMLLWLVSGSLWVTDMGYSGGLFWQYCVAAFGVMMASYAAILHLKQPKRF